MSADPPKHPRPLDAHVALSLASTPLHPADVPEVVARVLREAGFGEVAIYLSDIEQHVLLPFGAAASPEPLSIDGTIAGRAYRTEQTVVPPPEEGDATTIWLPLLDSAERFGAVSITPPAGVVVDETTIRHCEAIVNLIGEIVANKSQYGDVIATTRRLRDLTVAAELRWSMLPPLTYTGRGVSISATVAPAYEIAGDTFDYAVAGDDVHLAIIDAVGHGLEAARIANLAVGTYRNSRRKGVGAVDTYRAMDSMLADQFGTEKFATAQLATLSVPTGRLRWVNAGHPPPLVIRQAHHLDLASEVSLPVGLGDAGRHPPHVAEAFLEPGDRVLFFTDGIVEARSVDGEEFGRTRLADLAVRAAAASQRAAETVRLLSHAVLAHQEGVLQDDATLLLLTWDPPES